MKLSNQAGFTLIEVTIVMAIAALLAVGILFSQSQFRQRLAFSAAVESVRTRLRQIQTEAIASVNVSGSGSGGLSNQRIFGKLVEFKNGSNTVTTSTLLGDDADLSNGFPYAKPLVQDAGSVSTFTMNDGIKYAGTDQAIIFTRSPDFMYAVVGYTAPPSAALTDTKAVLNPNNYVRNNIIFNPASPLNFNLTSPNTALSATLKIDTGQNAITQSIN
jgi:prepilin-type N-terminal cleavage/methylation domain-containing protein